MILLVLFFEMFRNRELLERKENFMQQEDMERFAFLYLCGAEDRDILLGRKRMTFMDFDRLTYLIDFSVSAGLDWKSGTAMWVSLPHSLMH